MKKQIFLLKDENNAIVLSKDNFNGVVIQVVRFVDQAFQHEGQMLVHKTNQVVFQLVVAVGSAMRDEVAKAILESKKFLADIKSKDDQIDGLINDYLSSHRELNEPDQQ